MRFGLKEEIIEKICRVFEKFPSVQSALLYGSRAKGTEHPGSDIDLALFGKGLSLKIVNRIGLELDDLLLPYTIDLTIYHHISNPALIEHIGLVKKSFYQKNAESPDNAQG